MEINDPFCIALPRLLMLCAELLKAMVCVLVDRARIRILEFLCLLARNEILLSNDRKLFVNSETTTIRLDI